MALINVNGLACIEATICVPRIGAWHMDLVVDTPDVLSGPVTVSVDGGRLAFKGTVSRGGNFVDTGHVRVVGGAGGLGKLVTPKHYTTTSVGEVLADLASNVGEAVSSAASQATLALRLDAWTTAQFTCGSRIGRLLRSADPLAAWRVLADGTLFVGQETWPDSGLVEPADYQIISDDPKAAEQIIAVEVPTLLPGTTLAGKRIGYVEHRVDADGVKTRVWFDEGSPSDGMKEAISRVVESVSEAGRNVDHRAMYAMNVVRQAGATIDLEPDNDERLPSMSKVPLFLGLPGATSDGAVGGRALVGWHGGDPARPYALSFDAAASGAKVVLAADQLFLGGEVGAEPAILGATYREAEAEMHSVQTDTATAVASALTTALAGELMPPAGAFVSLYPQTTALLLTIGADVAARLAAQSGFEAGSPTYLTTNAKVL